jgi:hypothetical protein
MTNEGRGEEIRELVEEGANEEKIGSNCQDREGKREERERELKRKILYCDIRWSTQSRQ